MAGKIEIIKDEYIDVLERIKEAEKARKKNYTVTIDINPYSFI